MNNSSQQMKGDHMTTLRESDNYPYTFAADYVRGEVGDDYRKGLISRIAAVQAISIIVDAIGVNKEEAVIALAEEFIKEGNQGQYMIKCYKRHVWDWSCPECGYLNREDCDPLDSDTAQCTKCGSVYKYLDVE